MPRSLQTACFVHTALISASWFYCCPWVSMQLEALACFLLMLFQLLVLLVLLVVVKHAVPQTAGRPLKYVCPDRMWRAAFPVCCCTFAPARDAVGKMRRKSWLARWGKLRYMLPPTMRNTCCRRPIVQRYQSVSGSRPSVSERSKCSDRIIMKRWKTMRNRRFWFTFAASSFSSMRSTT